MMLFHLRQNSVFLVAELDFRRVNPPDTVLKLDNSVDLPDLASGMTAPQRTCVYYIGPMLPAMKISKFTVYLTEPGFPFDFAV
jgi:hypothetical protein